MKNLINKYILSWFRPKYKRLAKKVKDSYDGYISKRMCKKYGIENHSVDYMRNKYPQKERIASLLMRNKDGTEFSEEQYIKFFETLKKEKECCHGNCECEQEREEQKGKI